MSRQIPYSHQTIGADDIKAVNDVLKSDWLTQGPKISQFENALAKYCNVKYAVACSSGTAALHLAYLALGLKQGDEVITTPLSFSATSAGFCYLGAKPVFCDIDSKTLNIDPAQIEKKITKKTKAIAITDFAGNPCDIEPIKKIVKKYKLPIVEDACHSLGASYKGKKIGGLADLTVFSFHPVKSITTGEGGAVLINNQKLAQKMITFRTHGAVKKPEKGGWYYEIKDLGYNYRLTDMQAALGLSQLKKLDSFIAKRRAIAKQYTQELKNIEGLILPQETAGAKSAWHLYPIQLKTRNRKEVFDKLRGQGILTQVHYIPLHLQPYYQKTFGYKKGDFPVAEKYYSRCLSLPVFPEMTQADIQRVIKTLKTILIKK